MSSPPDTPTAAATTPAEAGDVASQPGLWALVRPQLGLIALLAAIGALVLAGMVWQRNESIARESARRLQAADTRATQLETQLKQAQEQARDLQSRAAVLEGKLSESLGQQAQLERLYRNISQDSVDAVLADVENSLSIASQQLVVAFNVQGALVALADADARLARLRQPQAIGMRRLIQRDIERLKAVPVVDLVGLALRLDTVSTGADQLPLLASAAAPSSGTSAASASGGSSGAQPQAKGFSFEQLANQGRRGVDALVGELRQLFRVSRVDEPSALLLAPEQQYFLRQNLRLQLLSARIALLSRLEPVYRADLDRAIAWLESHYDRNQRSVVNAVAALRQLQSAKIAPELPSLGDALAAVRAARGALETSP